MLGAYTERPLWPPTPTHIDHFRMKGLPWTGKNVTFDWNNLMVEDRSPDYGAGYKDAHTNSIDDYRLLLNPAVDYPEQFMTYNSNGEILPNKSLSHNDHLKATFTIQRFNLNHPVLREMRSRIIVAFLNMAEGKLTAEEIREAMADEGFPTVIEWLLEEGR